MFIRVGIYVDQSLHAVCQQKQFGFFACVYQISTTLQHVSIDLAIVPYSAITLPAFCKNLAIVKNAP